MINEYIENKIELTEEIMGRNLTVWEKNDIKTSFIECFKQFADKIGVDVTLIFDDIDLIAELDELIEYDFDIAKNTALKRLGYL